ncbi:MAG: hypothetical protein AAGD38_08540 [Acidobacteriota bacterium]
MIERLTDPELWKYISIPVLAAVVGWATNLLAVKMTFYPIHFVGIPPYLGWRGVIPIKAAKMASIFVNSTMQRLGRLAEVFEGMEPERMAHQVTAVISPRLDMYTDEVIQSTASTYWARLPAPVKQRVYEAVRAEMPRLVDEIVGELGRRVEEVTDLENMIVEQFEADPNLLNRLFLESGDAEFRFIVRSGFYFGFLFGLVQLAVWAYFPAWWVLPLFGGLVGFATNWLAINMIFRPLHPKKIGPFTIQGLFLRRQAEVATVWCGLVTREILTIETLIQEMLNGPRSPRSRELIREKIAPLADAALATVWPVGDLALGPRNVNALKKSIGDKAVQVSIDPFRDDEFKEDRAKLIEALLVERMVSLPPEQFQDLLRPCFQEDEWKLILLGAVLGLLAGTAQLVFVFGGA